MVSAEGGLVIIERWEGMKVILNLVGEALGSGCLGVSMSGYRCIETRRLVLDGWARIGGIFASTWLGGW